MSDNQGPSRRARRAVPLIAVAVAVIVLTGVLYMRAVSPAPSGALTPTSLPIMSGPYSATYDFVTPSLGWALVLDYSSYSTNYWIFKTTDGARHWQEQHAGPAEGGQIYIHFFDDRHGYAYAGISYITADGGAHWQTIEGVPGSIPYVTFASPTRGWAAGFEVGSKHLYTTSDGGMTWTRMRTDLPGAAVLGPVYEIQPLAFRESGEGWLGAGYLQSPLVYLTIDGGASWRTIAIPSPPTPAAGPGYLTNARLVPGGGVLVLVSDESDHVLGAFLSPDDGRSWRELTFPVSVTTADNVSFVDASHWWMLRSGQVYKTSDASMTWTQISVSGLPDGWRYESARAIDAQHAWWAMVSTARSTRSALAMTSDGGKHWAMVNPPLPQ